MRKYFGITYHVVDYAVFIGLMGSLVHFGPAGSFVVCPPEKGCHSSPSDSDCFSFFSIDSINRFFQGMNHWCIGRGRRRSRSLLIFLHGDFHSKFILDLTHHLIDFRFHFFDSVPGQEAAIHVENVFSWDGVDVGDISLFFGGLEGRSRWAE